jgi:signal transduction histidine kinase/ligand-binding sensor domain-containing protein
MGNLSFLEDHSGVFWITYTSTGHGSGLAVFDRSTNELTRYSIYDSKSHRELTGGMKAVVEDENRNLWFATRGDGLLRFDREHGAFIRYRNRLGDPESLAEDRVISLCADREGNVWAGLHALAPEFFRGKARPFMPLMRQPSNPNSFGETFVNAIYQDHQGILWVGTTGALIRIDRKHGQYTSYPPPGPGLENDIVAITEDRLGTLWIGTIGAGLNRFDRNTGRFKTYRHHASDPSSISDDAVSRILVDRSGMMWITTWNGFDRFDPATERFVVYKQDKQSLAEQYYNITQDQTGTLWIGGIMGLTRFDPSSGRVTVYSHEPGDPGSLSDNTVTNVYIDRPGNVWAATENGLNKLDGKNGTFTHYRATDGLPVNALSCILEDQSGKLWISSTIGLSRFDPLTKTFKNYSAADGLPGDDLTGWDACFKSSSGEMFFGGFSGGIAFYPDKVGDTSYIPPVVLTDFQLSGNPVEIGPQSLLKKSITYTNDLTLSHEQNVFSLTFSALSYVNPVANRYRYMLEGLDHKWTEGGMDHRLATYTTLPPGAYTFRVQGATSRGAWSEPGVKLGITILPPWWDTWWFRMLCAITAVAILLALYQLRLRQLAREFNAGLEARVYERTRIARELHDTLLQSFQGLLLRFQTASNQLPVRPLEAKQKLDNAIDLVAQAIAEGRDAVQGLRCSATVTNDLAAALNELGEELAANQVNQNSPTFEVNVEGRPRDLHPILRDEVYRIACEALRNAFLHAHAGRIEVEIQYDTQELRLRIRDDGKGIAPQFSGGDGRAGHFGLHGMRERAKLIGGNLELWSNVESGTEIELTIPASTAYARSATKRGMWLFRRQPTGNHE